MYRERMHRPAWWLTFRLKSPSLSVLSASASFVSWSTRNCSFELGLSSTWKCTLLMTLDHLRFIIVAYVHRRRFLIGERELAVRVADLFHAGVEHAVVTLLPPNWTETLRISKHQYAIIQYITIMHHCEYICVYVCQKYNINIYPNSI